MAKQLVVQLDRVLGIQTVLKKSSGGVPDDYGNSVSMEELCKRMVAKGYEYATLMRTTGTRFQAKYPPDSGYSMKPERVLYFSYIDTEYNLPDWKLYLDHSARDVREYAVSNIAFAKIKPGAQILRQDTPEDLAVIMEHRKDDSRIALFDWDKIASGTQGVIISNPGGNNGAFYTFDVHTLAVWDTSALEDVVFFMHFGRDFMYGDREIP